LTEARRARQVEGENTSIPLLRRGGRQFPSRKRGDCDSNRGVVDGVVADTTLREGNEHPALRAPL